ncbi:MAG TPA: sugar transferase [Pirellulales bacterium]|nr:sugar transferase [Pirellulales bacterium]
MKRCFDFTVALIALIALSPVFVLTAIAVRCDSRGPIFFLQQRVGRGFRSFWICKFRTMVVDAPLRGPQITSGEDPRITRVGRYLRKWKLDELPQLWNVFKGEMSLVGPRPEVPRYVEMFRDDYACLLSVRPGITDPASLKYRDEAAILAQSQNPEETYVRLILPEKIALAKRYVAQASLSGDLALIWQTICHVAR